MCTCEVIELNANNNLTFCCTNLQARATVPPFQGWRSCSAEGPDIPGHLSFFLNWS